MDMADEEKDCQDYSLPIYTDTSGKRGQYEKRNLKGKGWSREGMIRFQKIQMKIEDLFDNETEMMEKLSQSVLEKYREMYGKRAVGSINDETIESELEQSKRDQEDKEWDDFLRRNAKRRKIG